MVDGVRLNQSNDVLRLQGSMVIYTTCAVSNRRNKHSRTIQSGCSRSFGHCENGIYKPYTPPKHIPKTRTDIYTRPRNHYAKVDAWNQGQKDFYLEQIASFFPHKMRTGRIGYNHVLVRYHWGGYGLALRGVGKETLTRPGIRTMPAGYYSSCGRV